MFLISLIGSLVELGDKIIKWWKKKEKIRNIRKSQKYLLKTLSDDEKNFLSKYVYENVSTIYESYNNGTAKSLCAKKIIYFQSQTMRGFDLKISYNIQPWAIELLIKNKNFLK